MQAGAYGTFTVTTNFAQSQTSMDLFSNGKPREPIRLWFFCVLPSPHTQFGLWVGFDYEQIVGQTTPVTVRFSNALGKMIPSASRERYVERAPNPTAARFEGEKGSFDTARNVRGFAMKSGGPSSNASA